jgi:hypothetical protein
MYYAYAYSYEYLNKPWQALFRHLFIWQFKLKIQINRILFRLRQRKHTGNATWHVGKGRVSDVLHRIYSVLGRKQDFDRQKRLCFAFSLSSITCRPVHIAAGWRGSNQLYPNQTCSTSASQHHSSSIVSGSATWYTTHFKFNGFNNCI